MDREKVIRHIGTPRHSGRYPWGSGKDPYQGETKPFLAYVRDLKKQGFSDLDIAKGMGITTTELRNKYSIAKTEQRAANVAQAMRLKEKGWGESAIGRRMGVNESTVRSWLDQEIKERAESAAVTASVLRDAVDKKGLIDVGIGVEQYLGVSRTKLNTSLAMLKEEGYELHTIQVEQAGSGKYTNYKVLAPPGTTLKEVNQKRYEIKMVQEYSEDGGKTFSVIEPPVSINSKRILVRYKEDGGSDKDGLIELRSGTNELSLGGKNYAQVRIAVDDKYFMKGMAMYNNKMPEGIDIIYNVNKDRQTPIDKIYKSMKDDPDNPFGASIRQKHYIDSDGKEKLSPLNIVGYKEGSGEEGSWHDWSRNLSSQILSKQTPALAKKQLKLAYDLKKEEYDEIMSLTNPSVKKELLRQFSDGLDADAGHLKAAALPRQNTHVLLPFKSIKENEVYAPLYNNGERVVLLRHPHGGIFEIPELTVNNTNKEAKSIIGSALDAVGINPKVAQKLSGADFDGDAVIVIPNKNKYIKTAPSLEGLKDFDPKTRYKGYPGMKTMDARTKGLEMGKVSNLITDMTIQGASFDEIARAVRHSMVVIDAEKHGLNWKQSAIDNNISELKKKYQGKSTGGASTIISRAEAEVRINARKPGKIIINPKTGKEKRIYIDPKTGEKLYTETGETYIKRKPVIDPTTGKKLYYYKDASGNKVYYDEPGKIVIKKIKSTQMAEEKNPYKLSSGTTIEDIYAEHASNLKSLANKSRLDMINTKDTPYSPSARETYKKEVDNLNSQLALVYRNKPLERQAILFANKTITAKKNSNPGMSSDDLKKVRNHDLNEARARFKASRQEVVLTPRLWEAIQAGAVSPSKLARILENTNSTLLKEYAMPRYKTGLSPTKMARLKSLSNSGYTPSEIAESLGISINTVIKYSQ